MANRCDARVQPLRNSGAPGRKTPVGSKRRPRFRQENGALILGFFRVDSRLRPKASSLCIALPLWIGMPGRAPKRGLSALGKRPASRVVLRRNQAAKRRQAFWTGRGEPRWSGIGTTESFVIRGKDAWGRWTAGAYSLTRICRLGRTVRAIIRSGVAIFPGRTGGRLLKVQANPRTRISRSLRPPPVGVPWVFSS